MYCHFLGFKQLTLENLQSYQTALPIFYLFSHGKRCSHLSVNMTEHCGVFHQILYVQRNSLQEALLEGNS